MQFSRTDKRKQSHLVTRPLLSRDPGKGSRVRFDRFTIKSENFRSPIAWAYRSLTFQFHGADFPAATDAGGKCRRSISSWRGLTGKFRFHFGLRRDFTRRDRCRYLFASVRPVNHSESYFISLIIIGVVYNCW